MQLPEINFVTANPAELDSEIITAVEKYLGRSLALADPLRIFLKGVEAILIQQRLLIDEIAKMNLVAYSTGDYLNHLAALVGVERLPATRAVTTCQITLSAAREQTTTIKKGTRFTADNQIFFAIDSDVIFSAGEISKTATATATTYGESANNFLPGEVNKIVDPQAFLLSIENLTTTEGGSDIESDESLRERIILSPESYSCAGSEGAYKFHAKSTSALISDVSIDSPTPGIVDVYVLLSGGTLPGTEMLNAVATKLNKKTVRPMTDTVRVKAPTRLQYDIDLTYYISEVDAAQASRIVSAVENAVEEFITWQGELLGRDLNPDELIYRLKSVGVKRVVIRKPIFTVADKFSVATCRNKSVTYGGLE